MQFEEKSYSQEGLLVSGEPVSDMEKNRYDVNRSQSSVSVPIYCLKSLSSSKGMIECW